MYFGVFFGTLMRQFQGLMLHNCYSRSSTNPYRQQVGYREQAASGYIFMSWLPINIPVCAGLRILV
jgi:hypothetical protein